jgi:hypothetical protein
MDSSTIQFTPTAQAYVWCGAWEEDNVLTPTLHVWFGSLTAMESPGWDLKVVHGDFLPGDTPRFPNYFIRDHPDSAHIFLWDPPNELATNAEDVSVGANGSFVYTPPSGFIGTDTFTYIISDGPDATDLATVTTAVVPDPAGVDTDLAELPREFELLAPRPNPSRGIVELGFALPEAGGIRAEVFDAVGRSVTRLADDAVYAAGPHRLPWDGRDGSGANPDYSRNPAATSDLPAFAALR